MRRWVCPVAEIRVQLDSRDIMEAVAEWAQRRYPSLEGRVQVHLTASEDLDMMDRPVGTHTFAASVKPLPPSKD